MERKKGKRKKPHCADGMGESARSCKQEENGDDVQEDRRRNQAYGGQTQQWGKRDWQVSKERNERDEGGAEEKVYSASSFASRKLTDAGAVKKIGISRKVSSEDRSLQEDDNRSHGSAVVAQCTHEA